MSGPVLAINAADLWFDWEIDTWLLLMALLVGLSCGLLGTVFLVRRTALLGDAVSHSVLPGIAGGLLLAVDPAWADDVERIGRQHQLKLEAFGECVSKRGGASLIEVRG